MSHRLVKTDAAPAPSRHYSQASRLGQFIFTSGQGPYDPKTNAIPSHDIAEQTTRTLENLRGILEAEGSSFLHVLKVTVFVRRTTDIATVDAIFRKYFSVAPPPRTIVGADLARPSLGGAPGMDVEIEMIAYTPTP